MHFMVKIKDSKALLISCINFFKEEKKMTECTFMLYSYATEGTLIYFFGNGV